MGETQFTPDGYRFSDSRGYCEVYQEISQILIKYPVTTGISQGMADGPTLRSKSMGDATNALPLLEPELEPEPLKIV